MMTWLGAALAGAVGGIVAVNVADCTWSWACDAIELAMWEYLRWMLR